MKELERGIIITNVNSKIKSKMKIFKYLLLLAIIGITCGSFLALSVYYFKGFDKLGQQPNRAVIELQFDKIKSIECNPFDGYKLVYNDPQNGFDYYKLKISQATFHMIQTAWDRKTKLKLIIVK